MRIGLGRRGGGSKWVSIRNRCGGGGGRWVSRRWREEVTIYGLSLGRISCPFYCEGGTGVQFDVLRQLCNSWLLGIDGVECQIMLWPCCEAAPAARSEALTCVCGGGRKLECWFGVLMWPCC